MEYSATDVRRPDALAAWQQALAEVPATPALSGALRRRDDLFGRFAAWYGRLRSRPRAERRRWQRQLGLSLAGIALLLAVNGAPASAVGPAATITVDGVTCTLVDAITAANTDAATGGCAAGSGADIIDLQTNVTLTAVNNTTDGNNGLPVITSAITIEGNGNTISRNSATAFRILAVAGGANLTVNSATVSGGLTSDANPAGLGGGILNRGVLTVQNSTLSGNSATNRGGGIYNSGTLTVQNSTLSGNSSTFSGGGIYNRGIYNHRYGTLTVQNSTLSGNSAGGRGGGIHNHRFGTLTVQNSTLSGNSANSDAGGGIYNSGTLTVSNSTLSGNSATSRGGGIFNSGTLTVQSSTLSGNSAGRSGMLSSGGGIHNDSGTVTVSNSTLSGNSSGFSGGGIYNRLGTLTVQNSTLSGNSTGISGGGIFNRTSGRLTVQNSTLSGNSSNSLGGGISNVDNGSTMTVQNSTISGNSARNGGGGIYNGVGATATVQNSIVAAQTWGYNCGSPGTFNSGGYNIVGLYSYCNFTQASDLRNVTSASLALQPLANNGGPTQTRSLGAGSVAIDRIPAGALEANGCVAGTSTDQRNAPRAGGAGNGGSACDVGAYEFASTPLAVTLASFAAQAMVDRIQLSWETVSEANNAGFNLYRSESPATPDALLAFVPSQAPGSTQGASYSFDDTAVAPGQTWYYWLEDVDLNGATSLHGPVSATFQAPTAVTLDALQAEAANPASATTWGALAAALIAAAGVLGVRRRSRVR